jgi:integrase
MSGTKSYSMANIRLKYVNGFSNKQRQNKRPRYYFRRPGCKAIPLPGLPGSDQFMAAYALALADMPDQPSEIGASRTQPGTVNALVVAYYKGAWLTLAGDTRSCRRGTIERFRERHGDKRVALLREDHILRMLAEITSPNAKRNWLKTIRHLLRSAIPTMIKSDPTAGIAKIKLPKSRGHHTWRDEEIVQYRAHWPLGAQQRLVMEFALETASRRGEVVRLGPQHVRNGRIRIERTHGSADVDIRMSPELQAAVDAIPKRHLTYIITAQGKPRSKNGLGNDFAEWVTKAGLPARCRMHGLKKGGMRRLAEDGATAHELMAISGHKTLSEVQRYTADADRKKLADSGMAKRTNRDSDLTNIAAHTHKHRKKAAQNGH